MPNPYWPFGTKPARASAFDSVLILLDADAFPGIAMPARESAFANPSLVLNTDVCRTPMLQRASSKDCRNIFFYQNIFFHGASWGTAPQGFGVSASIQPIVIKRMSPFGNPWMRMSVTSLVYSASIVYTNYSPYYNGVSATIVYTNKYR